MKKISIVIPCYNSSESLPVLVKDILKQMETLRQYQYEIVLVNDGSPDGGKTWTTILKLHKEYNGIIAINFSKNFGQHSAMMAGYRASTGDYILGMDDDGENSPEMISRFVEKIEEGYDCVMAEYKEDKRSVRKVGTFINNLMAEKMINKPKDITLTSFYMCKRFVIDQVIKYENAYPYIAGLLLQATNNWGTIVVERNDRISGKSGYTAGKLLKLWVNGFTSFSVKPLRVATSIGFLFSIVGFVWSAVLIIRKLLCFNIAVGYTSIMAVLIFCFGLVLTVLGMIGEYIGRIYISINNAPQYVIKDYRE